MSYLVNDHLKHSELFYYIKVGSLIGGVVGCLLTKHSLSSRPKQS